MTDAPHIEIRTDVAEDRIPVHVSGEAFTAYLREDYTEELAKPVLYPLHAPSGTRVTRGFPLDPAAGERIDHPHHIGCWLNYGNVNGYDFWNNSPDIDEEREPEMGRIEHRTVRNAESGVGRGELSVTMEWLSAAGEALLQEKSDFVFRVAADGDARYVDRITNLTALVDADMGDDKEGMLGVRAAKEFEHPDAADEIITVLDEEGGRIEIEPSEGRTGEYLSSEGVRGVDAWGTRAKWMRLAGTIDDEDLSIAIMDHPENPGYPTYWHARDYGLFSANPLGQAVFSEGAERLGFGLAEGESATFHHRIAVLQGHPESEEMETAHREFLSDMRS